MIKGAIFDFDGTLVDCMPYWRSLGADYLKKLGITAEKDLGEKLYPMTLEESSFYLKERYKLPYTPEAIFQGVTATLDEIYTEKSPLKTGALEVLEFLKKQGIPMVIATATIPRHVTATLERYHIADYFKAIITTTEVGVGKDHPDIYIKSAEFLQTAPHETLIFEDAFHTVQTAVNAGFKTIAVADESCLATAEEMRALTPYYLKDFHAFFPYAEELLK